MKEKYWMLLLALAVVLFVVLNTEYVLPTGEVCLLMLPIAFIVIVGYVDSLNK